jgi:tRNA(fMet)-specific endonuclease VapC
VRYLLDTNTCIYALKGRDAVLKRLRGLSPDDLGVSVVSVAELWFGAEKSRRPGATRGEVDAFLEPLEIIPFDLEAAAAYARTRHRLERSGKPIGERDLLIASIALARELVVVTHDISEFGRVPDLSIEDWY